MYTLQSKNAFQFLVLLLIIFCLISCGKSTNSLANVMEELAKNGKGEIGSPFNGAVLVAKNGTITFKGAYGLYNRKTKKKNEVITKFPIGSLTKQFTAMLTMQLVDDKLLDVDDTISKHLSFLPKGFSDKITIHQLLSHTSGLPHYEGLTAIGVLEKDFAKKAFNPKELALLINQVKLIYEPGTTFHYSSLGYMLLGVILEEVTSMTYAQLVEKRIAGPLGLKNTGFANNKFIKNETARGYAFKEDETFKMIFMKYGGDFYDVPFRDQSNKYSTGGMHSTVEDLFIWSEAVKHSKLINEESTKRMLRPNLEGYCYGWIRNWDELIERNTNVRMYTHGGALYGHRSSINMFDDGTTIIFLANTTPIKDHKLIHKLYLTAHNLKDEYGLNNYPERNNLRTFEFEGGIKALNLYFDKLSQYCGYKVLPSDKSIVHLMAMYYEDGQYKIGDSLRQVYYRDYKPLESDINRLGYGLLESDCARALYFFKDNTSNYPNSPNAWDSLGEGFLNCNDYEKALASYEKAVEIATERKDKNLHIYEDSLMKLRRVMAEKE